MSEPHSIATQCCIAGGGPAGMMLGFLLARAGVDVVVLEKHADFFRDFRGDTIHPSTMEALNDLGLLEAFLKLPHQPSQLKGMVGDTTVTLADFSHLRVHAPFIALMPQWDFLNFLRDHAQAYPHFHLIMQGQADDLVVSNTVVTGVIASTPDGPLTIYAALVVAADGRHSTLRDKAGFVPQELGAPMDVLWFKLTRKPDEETNPFGRFSAGRIFVLINRGTEWQAGYVIAKGGLDDLKRGGLDALRAQIAELSPMLADRVHEIGDWDDLKLLSVAVDRLGLWHKPGFLCIGDAAHAMSPVGGIGINLAVRDAIATANMLAAKLRAGSVNDDDLAAVQKRREFPVRVTQAVQVFIQNRLVQPVLAQSATAQSLTPPWPVRLLNRFPVLRRLPARFVGMGVRPERVGIAEFDPARAQNP